MPREQCRPHAHGDGPQSRPERLRPAVLVDADDGASYYKVDVSSDSGFSSGSIVCCTDQTVATTMTPTTLLPSSQAYYWRVTPYDAENKAGTPVVWSDGQGDPQTFTITFDTASGIPGLSMRDSSFAQVPWVASDPNATDTPIVGWDDVPGAAYYEVQVSPFTGTKCDWATIDWDVSTITTAWTPLGDQHNVGASPVPLPPSSPIQLSTDLQGLATNGAYCVRVKAHRDENTDGDSVTGRGRRSATDRRRRSRSRATRPARTSRRTATCRPPTTCRFRPGAPICRCSPGSRSPATRATTWSWPPTARSRTSRTMRSPRCRHTRPGRACSASGPTRTARTTGPSCPLRTRTGRSSRPTRATRRTSPPSRSPARCR